MGIEVTGSYGGVIPSDDHDSVESVSSSDFIASMLNGWRTWRTKVDAA